MKRPRKQPRVFELRVLPIERLIPAPYNPRKVLKPTDKAYRKLEASIREFGLVEPLIWNERTGRVVGGHARLSILKAMKVRKVPVSVVQLTEAREKALNVVLNNQEAQGRYDTKALADLLEELDDLPELDLTGFDAKSRATLQLKPLTELVELEPPSSGVVVTLEMSEELFAKVGPKVDALVAEFDLVSHVQRH